MHDLMNYKENFDIFEGMTSISSVIHSITNGNSNRKIIKILYNTSKAKSKYNELKFLEIQSKLLGFELCGVIYLASGEERVAYEREEQGLG